VSGLEPPPPHFHVRYGGHKAILGIEGLNVLRGDLPARALGLVKEWGRLHGQELGDDWRLARDSQPLRPIDPLE